MMKNELIDILKKFNGFHPSWLYNDLIILEKRSSFDENEFKKFIIAYSLIMAKQMTLQRIIEYWNKSDKVSFDKVKAVNEDLDQVSSSWIGMSLPKPDVEVQNSDNKDAAQNQDEKPGYIKIYLSVDNNSLHKFANQFLISCLEYGYTDFDFKINKDESINRRDNVVLYCNNNNIGQYVNLVKEVIEKNPQIQFNQPHLLGIQYDEHIYWGKDHADNKKSYTEGFCEKIFAGLQRGETPEKIADLIDEFKVKNAPALYALVDMSLNNKIKH